MIRTLPVLRTLALVLALTGVSAASASAAQYGGGVSIDPTVAPAAIDEPTVPGAVAKLQANGLAAAPALAPLEVKEAIWAANKIIGKPYIYGGGHARFNAKGYDCSGTVSFALHGGDLLDTPLDSGSFMSWAEKGKGLWITVYTNPGHAFAVIAGLRLDTSAAGDPSGAKGPRWRPVLRATTGFKARHPEAL